MKFSSHVGCLPSGAKSICLLVELGPICNSMAASLCLKSCEDNSLLKTYNEMEKQFWALNACLTLVSSEKYISDNHSSKYQYKSASQLERERASTFKDVEENINDFTLKNLVYLDYDLYS